MTYLLDELEERGLLERRANPADRRSHLIHLTARGKKTQNNVAGQLAEQADFLLQPLSAAERSQLIDALTRSARALLPLQQLADATDR